MGFNILLAGTQKTVDERHNLVYSVDRPLRLLVCFIVNCLVPVIMLRNSQLQKLCYNNMWFKLADVVGGGGGRDVSDLKIDHIFFFLNFFL